MQPGRAILTSLLLLSLQLAQAAVIDGVRVWPAPDHTRIVFDVSDRAEHKIFTLSNPERLVIDLGNTSSTANLSKLKLPPEIIRRVRFAPRNGKDLRVVLDLSTRIRPRSFVLSPNQQYGHRLVVDLYPRTVQAKSPAVARKLDDKRDVIIAIDAGHGGEDPGAIGHRGVREKDVVLRIARELEALFAARPGFKPVLVRKADYYVGLRKRTQLARQHNADMMISIHADAFSSPKASGASVYVLSEKGASSETARWLAESENRADLIGGESGVRLKDKDDVLAGVLLDLSMSASMRASVATGSHVLKRLGKVTKLHKKRVEQAGFVVLKSPDVPSILIETGYISNPREAGRLNTPSHQQALARAIFGGVQSYFQENPLPGTWLAWAAQNDSQRRVYRIARGDTLSEIALRNNVTMASLKQLNGLSTNKIRVGQVIRIPSS